MRKPVLLLVLALLACGRGGAGEAPAGRLVGILVMDGLYNTELIGPYDVLDHAPGFEVVTVAPVAGEITTAEGLRLVADHGFADHPPLDILVIPSFEAFREQLEDERLIGWIREQAAGADWVLSHCWGAFYLAEAGLLDGRHATTFPTEITELGERYPQVTVHDGPRFVRDGKYVTSVGGTASYESPFWLLREIGGDALAERVAGGLVVDDWKLEGIRYVDRGP